MTATADVYIYVLANLKTPKLFVQNEDIAMIYSKKSENQLQWSKGRLEENMCLCEEDRNSGLHPPPSVSSPKGTRLWTVLF